MKIENRILRYFYGKAYKDDFYNEERAELKEMFGNSEASE